LVDTNTRRKMEEMLKTWKEPVPGSIDTRPVFPPEVTRPIENALIKARTSALQAHQEFQRSQQQLFSRGRPNTTPVPYRDTPTPPNLRQAPYAPPAYPPQAPQYSVPAYGQPGQLSQPSQQPYGQRYESPQVSYLHALALQNIVDKKYSQPQAGAYYPQATSSAPTWQQQIAEQAQRQSAASLETLNRDIANLIDASKAEFARSPYDSSIQTRLKALLDLQTILSNQQLPQDQIMLIKEQVDALSLAARPAPPVVAPTPPPAPVVEQPPPVQQPTLSSLLGPGGLAALLARQSATPQAQTPPPPKPAVLVQSPQTQFTQPSVPPVQAPPAAVAPPDPNSLLEKLRAAGMLPAATPAPASTPVPPLVLPQAIPGFPPSLPFLNTPPPASAALLRPALGEIPNDVVLNTNSLRM
jgi:pre-mRNA cleavage complex 2 protein Pcf11